MVDSYSDPYANLPNGDDDYVFYDIPQAAPGAFYIPPPRAHHHLQDQCPPPTTVDRSAHFNYDNSNVAQQGFAPSTAPLSTTYVSNESLNKSHPYNEEVYGSMDTSAYPVEPSPVPPPSWPSNHLNATPCNVSDPYYPPATMDPSATYPGLEAPRAVYPVQPVLDATYPLQYRSSYPMSQAAIQEQAEARAQQQQCSSSGGSVDHYPVFDQGYGSTSEVPFLSDSSAHPSAQRYYVPPQPELPMASFSRSSFSTTQAPRLPPSRSSSLAGWADLPPASSSSGSQSSPARGQQQPAASQVQQHQQPHAYQTRQYQQHPVYPRQELQHQQPRMADHQQPHHPHHPHQQQAPAQTRHASSLRRTNTMPEVAPPPQRQASLGPRSASEFDILSRPIQEIKASTHVRQAAKLRIDVGQADINSPTSHEARLKQRRNNSGRRASVATTNNVGYSPYQRERDDRRGSNASSSSSIPSPLNPQRPRLTPPQVMPPVVPSSSPIDRYGAQHTFVYNPYHEPHVVPMPESQPPTFPPTTVSSGGAGPVQHQTIDLSSPISPGEGRGKNADRPTGVDPATGEKRPFLACGFCRQRKICCGARGPHPCDNDLPDGPRTCNQCARRGYLCRYPSESRRGLRKERPTEIRVVDGVEVEVAIEEEIEYHPDGRRKRKKGRGPLEWINAVDAAFITPAAWETFLEEEAKELAAKMAAEMSSSSSGAGPCPKEDKEDHDHSHPPPPPPPSGPAAT